MARPRPAILRTVAAALLVAVASAATAMAQEPKAKADTTKPAAKVPARVDEPDRRRSVAGASFKLFTRANPMLWLLALCSIVTLGLRPGAAGRAAARAGDPRATSSTGSSSGSPAASSTATGPLELCQANDSPVARVFAHGRQLLGPARRDDPPGDRLRRRRRGRST